MATSNNPRKFSEKIALHNQKQAEETAAFEEVMKDLSITRAARVTRSSFPSAAAAEQLLVLLLWLLLLLMMMLWSSSSLLLWLL